MQRRRPHSGALAADLAVAKRLRCLPATVAGSTLQRLGYAAALLILIAVTTATVAVGNGGSRKLNAHEILVAQTATEMQERGEYAVPYYNGLIRLEKPPLPYWLAVLVHWGMDTTGSPRVSELEVRMPSLLAAPLLLIVTFFLGAVAFDDCRIGFAAAAILATSSDFFIYSRSARPEMLYALFCVLQMLGLMIAVRRAEHGLSTLGSAALAWAATIFAMYAKGPQSPALFIVGTCLALVMRRPRLSPLPVVRLPMGLAVVAVTVVPYFVYLAMQSQGAVEFWAGQMVQNTSAPWWLRPLRLFYPAAIIVGMAPWIVGVGLALRDAWKRRHPSIVVLASCVVVTVVSLSFVGKLRHHYVLPVTPLCAVLAAAAAVDLYQRIRAGEIPLRTLRNLGIAQAALTGIALLVGAALSLRSHAVTGQAMWAAAWPWLAVGAAFAVLGARITVERPAMAFASFVAAFFSAWMSVSVAGIDSEPRWALATQFAADVAEVTPARKPIYLESGIEESLVYYGRRRVIWGKVQDWLAAHPHGRPPLFVCEGECAGAEGRVITVQRDVPREKAMILFRPRRPTSEQSPGSAAASGGQATNRR
jgi:4-amino-4-deoxy-L-arabinose transferase-like glycosyltransferase